MFIRQAVFCIKRPSRILRKTIRHFAEGEIYLASGASCIYPYRLVQQASGHEPMGCVFHAHRWQTSRCCFKVGIVLLILLMIGMCTQERFFCQFLCPMGAIFAIMPIAPSALFNRDSGTCPAKCGACKKRCPAHLDIDGDTPLSGECICCHACQGNLPEEEHPDRFRRRKMRPFYAIGNSVGIPYSIKALPGRIALRRKGRCRL